MRQLGALISMAEFRYYDHPRNVVALLRAELSGEQGAMYQTAVARGIPVDLPEAKYLRETLWAMTRKAADLMRFAATVGGTTTDDLLDQMQVEFEAQIPEGHNADEPEDRP
jgi:hypothetical protein